jgi:glucokinase
MSNCLLADVGGTRARFALLSGSRIGPVHSLDVGAYANPSQAIKHFLNCIATDARIDSAVIAAAGPVTAGRCALTNASWVLETDELKRTFGLSAVNIVNDLEAVAWALPHLEMSDSEPIGRGHEVAGEPVGVIAPGTGLGVACLMASGSARVLASEGGHATLAATNAGEAALIDILRRKHRHVSAERVLSGPGLISLYAAIAELDGHRGEQRSAEEIVRAAIQGDCHLSRQALDTFCSFLGSFAGNTALMFGARGGLFIAGGIVPRIVDYIRRTNFRSHFESKGRFRAYLAHVPTRVIVRPDPAFLGLSELARRSRAS